MKALFWISLSRRHQHRPRLVSSSLALKASFHQAGTRAPPVVGLLALPLLHVVAT